MTTETSPDFLTRHLPLCRAVMTSYAIAAACLWLAMVAGLGYLWARDEVLPARGYTAEVHFLYLWYTYMAAGVLVVALLIVLTRRRRLQS